MTGRVKKIAIAAAVLLVGAAVAIGLLSRPAGAGVPEPENSVYYWRTTFKLDSVERDFLRRYDVKKIYMRYFDVVVNAEGQLRPNATLVFADTVPAGVKVIPTVFMMENCLSHDVDSVASLLVKRVRQMSETNEVPVADELQIDCDWTARSQAKFFSFLSHVRDLLKEHGMTLSVTVRLHQLSMAPPPADYGVLMVYNTGDFTRKDGGDPILNPDDVAPYLKHVAGYDLPLCAAYPCFSWNLLYSGSTFKTILYDTRFDDASLFAAAGEGKWVVVQNRDIPQFGSTGSEVIYFNAGDSVIHRCPSPDDILKVRTALSHQRKTINNQVILYSLDSKSLNNYNSTHYEKIFSH